MRILFVADVFGAPGRRALEQRLPSLRAELALDFCVVNGENASDGAGITPKQNTPTSKMIEYKQNSFDFILIFLRSIVSVAANHVSASR